MKKNAGSTDRIIRIILAIAIGYFAYSSSFEIAWLQTVLYVVAAIFLLTAVFGYCPCYTIFKINTCKVKE